MGVGGLLRLQRSAGNRAVAQRFGAEERPVQRLSNAEARRIAEGDEATAARRMLEFVRTGDYRSARQIAVAIPYLDTDDVTMRVMRSFRGLPLQVAADDPAGRRLLLTLFHHLMTGSVDDDERASAQLISTALQGAESSEEATANGSIMVFPWRNIAWTDVRQTVYEVEPRGNALLHIKAPNAVLAYFSDEANLPSGAYTRGFDIPANARIRIINHDTGRTENTTAVRLLELINGMNERGRDMTTTAVVTGATLGLSGAGAAYGLGAEGAAASTSVVIRAGSALAELIGTFARIWGPISTAITEHEGTLVEHYGEPARRFVRYVRQVSAIVSMAQGVTALAQLPGKLRDVYRSARELRRVMRTGAGAEDDLATATVAVGDAIRELNGSRGDLTGAAGALTNRRLWQDAQAASPGAGGSGSGSGGS